MSRARKILWNGVSILCTVILISMIASKLLTGWNSVFSYRAFYIMSESMEPEISVNQVVIGQYVPEEDELIAGEIYAYRREGIMGQEIIIHRLLTVTEDGRYQFKGDNNQLPDTELVEREEIGYRMVIY